MYFHIRRRSILYLAGLMVLLIIIGFTYGHLTRDKTQKRPPDIIETDNEKNKFNVSEAGMTDNAESIEGSGYGSVIVLERFYLKCGHELEDITAVNADGIGLARDMLRISYPGFEIVGLTPEKVTLRTEIDGYCPHHYIIGESDGYLAVYRSLKENGALYQIESTGIQFDYLVSEMQEKIKEGLAVDTIEEVELLFENWES